jgi:hypothetical protein
LNARRWIVLVSVLLLASAAGYRLWKRGERPGAVEPPTLAGTYELDRGDWRQRLVSQAESWVEHNSHGSSETAREELLKSERARAESAADGTRITLELRADNSFRLHTELPDFQSTGIGRWEQSEAGTLLLHAESVEGTADEGPPPVLELEVQEGVLVVKPSPGVPFEHRLVRK